MVVFKKNLSKFRILSNCHFCYSVSFNFETWRWIFSNICSMALLRPGSSVPRRSWPLAWPFLTVFERVRKAQKRWGTLERSWTFRDVGRSKTFTKSRSRSGYGTFTFQNWKKHCINVLWLVPNAQKNKYIFNNLTFTEQFHRDMLIDLAFLTFNNYSYS
jgi:hypothetical protein